MQKPHKTPTGPARSHPQHPFDAEKSFPSVCVDVMIWQFSLPHFGHFIVFPPYIRCSNSLYLSDRPAVHNANRHFAGLLLQALSGCFYTSAQQNL